MNGEPEPAHEMDPREEVKEFLVQALEAVQQGFFHTAGALLDMTQPKLRDLAEGTDAACSVLSPNHLAPSN